MITFNSITKHTHNLVISLHASFFLPSFFLFLFFFDLNLQESGIVRVLLVDGAKSSFLAHLNKELAFFSFSFSYFIVTRPSFNPTFESIANCTNKRFLIKIVIKMEMEKEKFPIKEVFFFSRIKAKKQKRGKKKKNKFN